VGDQQEVDAAVEAFFSAFSSAPGLDERMAGLRELLDPDAVITRVAGEDVETMSVEAFVGTRHALLSGGRLAEFREWETEGETRLAPGLAHRWCTYAKAWTEDGAARTGRGTKTIQLVRRGGRWRITAVAWSDE
jgi:hypothetical protein